MFLGGLDTGKALRIPHSLAHDVNRLAVSVFRRRFRGIDAEVNQLKVVDPDDAMPRPVHV